MSGTTLLAAAVTGRGLVDPAEPVIAADDEGFTRGRAAFETMRVYDGRPFRLQQHLDRLVGSARRIGLELPDVAELESLAAVALREAATPEAVLRLYWTPGPPGGQHRGVVLVGPIPAWIEGAREQGQRLVSLLHPRRSAPWLLPATKSTSYAVNIAAELEARSRGADDAVFVDADGIVLEGPVTNVWWRAARRADDAVVRAGDPRRRDPGGPAPRRARPRTRRRGGRAPARAVGIGGRDLHVVVGA